MRGKMMDVSANCKMKHLPSGARAGVE